MERFIPWGVLTYLRIVVARVSMPERSNCLLRLTFGRHATAGAAHGDERWMYLLLS